MKILHFNWAALDVKGGVKYTIGVSIVIALSMVIEFSWLAVGTSALLAWLVNVPGPRRERLTGVVIYIVIGAAMIGLVYALRGTYWPWLISMVVVAFLGTFAMIRGDRGFMIGWCLICWFYVAPILGTAEIHLEILSAHLLGSVVILLLVALPFNESTDAKALSESQSETAVSVETPGIGFVTSYSATVAIVMVIGLVLGDLWLKSDPTLILQASLMILMPSVLGTWTVAVDRMLGLIAGGRRRVLPRPNSWWTDSGSNSMGQCVIYAGDADERKRRRRDLLFRTALLCRLGRSRWRGRTCDS